MDLSENLKTSLLVEIYGNLLTDKQREVVKNFVDENMSLGEIADVHKTTRQAVNDLIKRTTKTLNGYEEKLKLLEKFELTKERLAIIIDKLSKDNKNKEVVNQLNKVLEDL